MLACLVAKLFSKEIPKQVVVKTIDEKEEFMSMVGEPVLTFVECVKRNPKRFRCRPASMSDEFLIKLYGYSKSEATVVVTDRKLYRTWSVRFGGHSAGTLMRIRNITNLPFELNVWEQTYLLKELFPVFTRGMTRMWHIENTKKAVAQADKAAIEKKARMEMLEEYKC